MKKKFTSREDCVKVFESYNFSVADVSELIIVAMSRDNNDPYSIPGLPIPAFLDNNLDVVYKGGKRYNKLEKAIKFFASL